MNAITENILREAADAFAFDRTTGEISRYGEGHINDTFVVWASDKCKRYIMQRINTDTFKNPKELMENVCNVTSFLRKVILENGGDPERETLNVIPTKDGKPFYTDSDGGTWRAYIFVEDTVCLQKVENENDFYTVAETFGTFQNQLAAFPAATLHETIVKFHDTPTRYQNFEKAVAEDAMGRAKDVADEIAFVRSREADCHVLVDMLSKNEIPLRVTHNDTKLNNVLIDKTSKKGVCVIDLDTVMPGLAAYDFGAPSVLAQTTAPRMNPIRTRSTLTCTCLRCLQKASSRRWSNYVRAGKEQSGLGRKADDAGMWNAIPYRLS